MIDFKKVTFQYNKSSEPALKDVSLHIDPGEFVGIIGTSGAGKTTFANCLNGIVPHFYKGDFYGEVSVNGLDTVENAPEKLCLSVGEVFQDIDSQMVSSVVEDEILFGMENFGIPHEEIQKRLDEALKMLHITELRTRQISTLSGGQKQKVAIASIIALRPEIIVLDEPTGELDPESSMDIFRMLKQLNEQYGMTVIVIEQKIMLLCEFVKRLLILDGGTLKFDGVPREIISKVEEVKQLGIHLPRVSELSVELKNAGLYDGEIALNVDEAQKMVEGVLKQHAEI